MIRKFIAIKNVARFHDLKPKGDVTFRELTLIYSENGRGKSTISTVLQSLSENNASLLLERTTIGGTGIPEVKILTDTGEVEFKSAKWTVQDANIVVFNSNFVHSNVYSGQSVETSHRKNNAEFVLGEEGVKLQKRIDGLDVDSRTNLENQDKARKKIDVRTKSTLSDEAFIALKTDSEIDQKISEQRLLLKRLEDTNIIRTHEVLSTISNFNTSKEVIEGLLARSIDSIHVEAEIKTKDHVKNHLDGNGEAWLAQGLAYLKMDEDESCPFCARSTNDVDIIGIYKEFFDDAYSTYKSDTLATCNAIIADLSPNPTLGVLKSLREQASNIEYWRNQGVIIAPLLPSEEEVADCLQLMSEGLLPLVERKRNQPTEEVILPSHLTETVNKFDNLHRAINIFNGRVPTRNSSISAKRAEYLTHDKQEVVRKLSNLEVLKDRFSVEAITEIDQYLLLQKEKKQIDGTKDKAKEELRKYSQSIYDRYEKRINAFLSQCGAGFEIVKTDVTFAGGKASSTYKLRINNRALNLSGTTEPCFKNTLSEGDKSTLSYAFFIARLLIESDLSEKVIVIDDPIASLDEHRRTCTKDTVIQLSKVAKQVIVLSHMVEFLGTIKDSYMNMDLGDTKDIEIATIRSPSGYPSSQLSEWNIHDARLSQYHKTYKDVVNYQNDLSSVDHLKTALQIRRVLEGYFRRRYPLVFPDNKYLGHFVGMIREVKDTNDLLSPLYPMVEFLDELEKINDFSKEYHHDDGSPTLASGLTDSTLRPWVNRTLRVIYGFTE